MLKAIIFITLIFIANSLYADTIFMKDGKSQKGLVVDEYDDRITLSTVDGEREILRSDIDRILYDTPEQNFMQLGNSYENKGWYDKALSYYKKAMGLNPDYKEARDAYLAAQAKMWREEEKRTKKELEHKRMVMDWSKREEIKEVSESKDRMVLLEESIGITLVEKDGRFLIESVQPYSSADKAGIKKGDYLVGIWDDLLRYSDIEDVLDELIGPKYSEVKLLFEKKIEAPITEGIRNLYKDLGVSLNFEYEGLILEDVVSGKLGDKIGLKKGDFLVSINDTSTRYTPLNDVIVAINDAASKKNIILNIRRKVILRREAGE